MLRLLLAASAVWTLPALAEPGSPTQRADDVPTVMIARVPAVGNEDGILDQRTDTDVDVFALKVDFKRHEDGKLDLEEIREQIIQLMAQTEPVTVRIQLGSQVISDAPAHLKEKFAEAEADSVAAYDGAAEAVVVWRGYGPVAGYNRGVVAFSTQPYRGYYPRVGEAVYGVNPYLGYYAYGRTYPFTYGVYRYTPSYHYFAYHRYY